jgi:hypothetical protein
MIGGIRSGSGLRRLERFLRRKWRRRLGREVRSPEYLVASRELSREETLVIGIECDHGG